jgi:hypothetical protein
MATNSSTYRGGAKVSDVQKKTQADFTKFINTRPVVLQPGQVPTPSNAGISKPGTMASNYGAGAGGAVIGKAGTPAKISSSMPAASAVAGGTAKKPSPLTDLLRVPGLENIYNPILEQLKSQQDAANKRYESNQANLKNIFGALSGLATADQARIKEQFTTSIAAQQQALDSRVAEQRAAAEAGVAQAEATGAERGAGPGMATNPIQTATTEGINQANAYQTTWENLQRANQAQAVEDTRSRAEGYNYQQVAALQGLQQSLEDKLMQIGGNTAQVQSDIAKAKFGQETNIAQAKYGEAVAAKNAAASAAAAAARAAAKPKTYSRDIYGFQSKVNDKVGSASAYSDLAASVDAAYAEAAAKLSPSQKAKGTAPKPSQVLQQWRSMGGGGTAYEPFANEYINRYSGLSK